MEAELLRQLMSAVHEDTEVRVKVEDVNFSEGIARVDLINGVMYLVLRENDERIVPARHR